MRTVVGANGKRVASALFRLKRAASHSMLPFMQAIVPKSLYPARYVFAFWAASRPEFTWLPNAVPGMLIVYTWR